MVFCSIYCCCSYCAHCFS